MSKTTALSPKQFGALHKQMFTDIVAPFAKGVGAKALSSKLSDAVRAADDKAAINIVADNIQEIKGDKRSVPLKTAYEKDQILATAAAKDAARSTDGKLTPKSAKFLPLAYRADYERITGLKIDKKPGVATEGVSIKTRQGGYYDVKIDFEKALAGAKAHEVVLAVMDRVIIGASRLEEPVQDPSIPPYMIVISPREGKLADSISLVNGNQSRRFNDPSDGHIISAGQETLTLVDDDKNDKRLMSMTFNLDKTNDYGGELKNPSEATRAVRERWLGFFSEESTTFDLQKGFASGKLDKVSRKDIEKLKDGKKVFSAIRETTNLSITKLIEYDLVEFARDPKTKSLVVQRLQDGEGGAMLSVLDEKTGKWVGTWWAGDDASTGWIER